MLPEDLFYITQLNSTELKRKTFLIYIRFSPLDLV